MSTSPYHAPQSKLVDRGSEPASATKAVLLAVAIDIGGTMAVGTALTIAYAGMLLSDGADPEQLAATFENIPPMSMFSLIGMACGTLISGIAGFVCARLSQRRDYKLGFILAGIVGAFGFAVGYASYPLAMHAVMLVVSTAVILLGMKLGMPKAGQATA